MATKLSDSTIAGSVDERLRLAMQAGRMGWWIWDIPAHQTTYCDELGRLFGLPEGGGTASRDVFLAAIHEADRERFASIVARVLKKDLPYEAEYRVVWPDGSVHWLASRGTLYRDRTGKPLRVAGVAMDISERKQAEEAMALRVRQQAVVAKLGQLALAGTNLQRLFDQAVTWVAESLGVEFCKVLELLPDRSALRLVAGVGWKEGLVGQVTVGTERASQAGYTLLSRNPVIVEDLLTETRFNGPKLLHDHDIISGLSVIIGELERPFGVLGAHTARRQAFTLDDVNFFQSVANVLAEAIQRTKAEEALRLSEDRFRGVVEGSLQGIIIHQNDIIRYANPAAVRMFGWDTPEELIGRETWETLVVPEEQPAIRARIAAVLRGERIAAHPGWRAKRHDGSVFWVTTTASHVVWDGLSAVVSIYLDITEQKRGEDSLRESEMKFRTLTEESQAGFVIIQDDRFKYVNPAVAEMIGYSREEMLAAPSGLGMVAEEDREFIGEIQRGLMESEAPSIRVSFRVRKRDGSLADLDVLGSNIAFLGRPAVLGTVLDVTERKQAEEATHASAERLRLAVKASNVGLWDWDLRTNQVSYSRNWKSQLGYQEDEISNDFGEWERRVHADDLAPTLERVQRHLARSDEEAHEAEFRMRHKDGSWRWIYARGEVFRDADGKPVRMMGCHVDITERKHAEESLRVSEAKYRSIFDNAVEGMFRTSPDGRFLDLNPALARIYGYSSPAEALAALTDIGRQLYVDPSRRQEFARLIEAQGTISDFEFQIRRRDGTIAWVTENARAVHDGTGALLCYEGTVEDITERKRAGEQVREKGILASLNADVALSLSRSADLRDMLRSCAEALVRNLGAAFARIWTLNHATNVLELQASAGVYTHLDGPHSRVPVGKFKIGWIAQERKPHLTNDVLHDPRVSDQEWARREGMVAFAGYPLLVESKLVGVMALFARQPLADTIVTALASVADGIAVGIERKRSEVLLASVLDNVSNGIIGIDEKGMICSFNVGAERLFDYKATEVIGRNVSMLMPEPYRSGHDDYIANYLRTGQAKIIGIGRDVEARRKDGTTFPVHLNVSEFLVDGKRHFTGVARDITKEKSLEQQFRQAQKMEAIGRLAGGVAHDFNNLLTVINGYSEVLLTKLHTGDPLREGIEMIKRSGERAVSLTRQLLAFSRKQVLVPVSLDLNALLTEMEKMLHRLIGEDIDLKVSGAPGLWAIKADASQIEQVVMNLVINARDAMAQGGKLAIETCNVNLDETYTASHPETGQGPHVLLAVSDTGCGMDAATKAHIFEPFFSTKGEKGTGLGLATVFGIVKQSGGAIDVQTAVGQGTTFRIYLPRETEAGPSRKPLHGVPTVPCGNETILVVDDDDGVRQLTRTLLENHGYRVLVARSGGEAILLAEQHRGPIHLLVSDVVMPNMSGPQLVERLTSLRPDVRVLFLSGYTDDAVVDYGVLGVDVAFLQKPFTSEGLARKVREVLELGPDQPPER